MTKARAKPAAKPQAGKKPARWGLWVPWVLAAALVIGWAAYWHVARDAALRSLASWSSAQEAETGVRGYATAEAHGFPLRLILTLTDAAYADAAGVLRAETERAELAVNLTNPAHVILAAPAPVIYRLNGDPPKALTGAEVLASFRMQDGRLARASFEATNLRLADPGATEGGVTAARLVAHVRPDVRDAAAWQLAVTADDLRLRTPVRGLETLGATLARAQGAFVITKPDALIEPGAQGALETWRQAAGEARIETLTLDWGGVQASGTGRIALDPDRRLAGRFETKLENPEALLRGVAGDSGVGGALARAIDELDAVFHADNGALSIEARTPFGALGPYPIRTLEAVY